MENTKRKVFHILKVIGMILWICTLLFAGAGIIAAALSS